MKSLFQFLLELFPEDKRTPLEQYIIDGQPQNNGDVDMLTRQFLSRGR
jgi:hypothetical protein